MREKYSALQRLCTRAHRLFNIVREWLEESNARHKFACLEKQGGCDDTQQVLALYDLIHTLERQGKNAEALLLRRRALKLLQPNTVNAFSQLLPAA